MPLMKRGTPFNMKWKFLPYSSFSLFNSIFLIPIFLEVKSTSLPPDISAALFRKTAARLCRIIRMSTKARDQLLQVSFCAAFFKCAAVRQYNL